MLPAMSAAGRTCVLPVRAAKGIRVAQVGNGKVWMSQDSKILPEEDWAI